MLPSMLKMNRTYHEAFDLAMDKTHTVFTISIMIDRIVQRLSSPNLGYCTNSVGCLKTDFEDTVKK